MISLFTQFITDRANPYFEKHYSQRNESYFCHENRTVKQKWYNDECRWKREIYNEALYNYNLNRNNDTRKLMLDAKKDYKYYCRSCKLKFSYEQGRKMNDLHKSRPREFWKKFKRKASSLLEPDVSKESFFQYFKSLATKDTPLIMPKFLNFYKISRLIEPIVLLRSWMTQLHKMKSNGHHVSSSPTKHVR